MGFARHIVHCVIMEDAESWEMRQDEVLSAPSLPPPPNPLQVPSRPISADNGSTPQKVLFPTYQKTRFFGVKFFAQRGGLVTRCQKHKSVKSCHSKTGPPKSEKNEKNEKTAKKQWRAVSSSRPSRSALKRLPPGLDTAFCPWCTCLEVV